MPLSAIPARILRLGNRGGAGDGLGEGTMFDQVAGEIATTATAVPRLKAAIADLAAMTRPTEAVFLAIGQALERAATDLGQMEGDFVELSRRLDADESARLSAALTEAIRQSIGLAGGAAEVAGLLDGLAKAAGAASRPLAVLTSAVAEISALAINAKIQAVQVLSVNANFSVFTTEIGRLGHLAGAAVGLAADHFGTLRAGIGVAVGAVAEFERTDAHRELDAVRQRLEAGLAGLLDRRRRSQTAMAELGERSRRIAARVAACVTELQINDRTCQRIDHVRRALELLCGLLEDSGAEECAWAAGMAPDRLAALVAAVCRLQASQLDRAVAEYRHGVGRLCESLAALSTEAAALAASARQVFGAGAGASFVDELQGHADRAAFLLGAYAKAEAQVRSLVESVSGGFRALVEDMEAIHSVDADMRVMGLNATLKCGRLGDSGRTLGIIAQELRSCGRRTEEASHAISSTIADAADRAKALVARSETAHGEASALVDTVATSMQALAALGDGVADGLARLETAGASVSTLLADAAGGIQVHHQVGEAAAGVAALLQAAAEAAGVSTDTAAAVHDDVRRLLERNYTMASERMVHQLFGEDASPAEAEGADGIDALFL